MTDDILREFGIEPGDEVDIIHDITTVVPDTPAALSPKDEQRVVTLTELKDIVTRKLKQYGARRVSWQINEGVPLETTITHFVFSRGSRDVYLVPACPKSWRDPMGEVGRMRIEPALYRDVLLDVLADEGIQYTCSSQ